MEQEEKVEIENALPRLQFDEGPYVSSLETNSLIDSSIPQDQQRSHLDDVVYESKSASKNRVPTATTTITPTSKQSPSASVSSLSSVSSDKSDTPREKMQLDIEKGSHDQKLVDIHDKAQEDECNVDLGEESDIETGSALLHESTKPLSLHGSCDCWWDCSSSIMYFDILKTGKKSEI